VFNCRGCNARGDVIALVMIAKGASFAEAVAELAGGARTSSGGTKVSAPDEKVPTDAEYARRQHDKARWLWQQRHPTGGTIAERYLRGPRGYGGPLPATLGFLPARKAEHHPALIAAFGLADEPEPGELRAPRDVGAVHLTLLKSDGSGKADVATPKLMIGSPGALPIALAPPNDLLGLAIVEGIETGLSVYAATGLSVWAAGAAGRMPAIAAVIPSYIEAVTIYQEGDGAGQLHTQKLAGMLAARVAEVRLAETPP
jgi:hypothetical protein